MLIGSNANMLMINIFQTLVNLKCIYIGIIFKLKLFFSYKIAMPQLADACIPATWNKERPRRAIAGATVIGVMYLRSNPTIPVNTNKHLIVQNTN